MKYTVTLTYKDGRTATFNETGDALELDLDGSPDLFSVVVTIQPGGFFERTIFSAYRWGNSPK